MTYPLSDRLGHVLEFSEDHPIFDPRRRHDFVFLFDATRCNPNGDPDNDNLPRQDLEDQHGFVTDVCQKRKLRRFVGDLFDTARENQPGGMNLFAKHRGLLGKEKLETRKLLEEDPDVKALLSTIKKSTEKDKAVERLDTEFKQGFFRRTYWDVRLFGAVLTTGQGAAEEEGAEGDVPLADACEAQPALLAEPTQGQRPAQTQRRDPLKAGQCVGPVQIGYAVTVEPITTDLIAISSSALPSNKASKSDKDETSGSSDSMEEEARSGTFGNKAITPYGLYRSAGQYAPKLDKRRNFDKTLAREGFVTGEDLAVLWNGLRQMFNDDTSAARPGGSMKPLAAWIFTHDHQLGNYPLHKLHELIKLVREGGEGSEDTPARAYTDHKVLLDWEKEDGAWALNNGRLTKGGKEVGVTVTELYNDWRD